MRKLCVLFVVLAACVAVQAHQLVDGERLDNIQIGKSTISDVIATYGDEYKLKKFASYSDVLVYEKLGLAFYACQADPKQEIFVIVMQAPFSVETSNGIVLGKSTFADLYDAYGLWNKTSAGFQYEAAGVYFDTEPELFEGFETDDRNFSGVVKEVVLEAASVPAAALTGNFNLNLSGRSGDSNEFVIDDDTDRETTTSTVDTTDAEENDLEAREEESEVAVEIKTWGKNVVRKIELIEKGRLRQCGSDFRNKN